MISYLLKRLAVEVSIDSESPDVPAKIVYRNRVEGLDMIEVARRTLSSAYGRYGHLIGDATTPIDLAVAIDSPAIQQYAPELERGAEIVKNYKSPIPKGSVS